MKKNLFAIIFFAFSATVFFAKDLDENKIDSELVVGCLIESKMMEIPGGTFLMGSENQEENEVPLHYVTLDAFYLESTEVTQWEYDFVMGENNSKNVGQNLPVEEVSWYDAIVFCNRLSLLANLEPAYSLFEKTNPDEWGSVPRLNASDEEKSLWNKIQWNKNADGYRLPTEAEWEYAAGLPSDENKFVYCGGDDLNLVAWSKNNSDNTTHNVATKNPNGYRLFDMGGNVWEWCWDWYGRYGKKSLVNPDGAQESVSGRKVRRGGSFKSDDEFCRNTNRASSLPEIRGRDLGFRLARSIKPNDRFYLSVNDLPVDFKKNPFSVLISSYKDNQTASSEQKRLEKLGVKSFVVKKYSAENKFDFELHSDFFADRTDAENEKNRLKKIGVADGRVVNFSDYEKAFYDYNGFVILKSVAYDDGCTLDAGIFSDSVEACLKSLPRNDDYLLDYLEVADFENINSNGQTLSKFMLQDFFGEEKDKIKAAVYAEFSDQIFGKSLIVVSAKSDEGYFSNKAESFASTFMDGVYQKGNFSLKIQDFDCSVVSAYGQLVLCGNSLDGSEYVLIFARGFTKELMTKFVDESYGTDAGFSSPIRKTLFVLPSEGYPERKFLKFCLAKNEVAESVLSGYFVGEADYILFDKKMSAKIYETEYDSVADDLYEIYGKENESAVIEDGKKFFVGENGVKFKNRYFIVELSSPSLDEECLIDFGLEMRLW